MNILSRIVFKLRLKIASDHQRAYVYAKYLDIQIGRGARITGNVTFGSEPYLIEIGDNVTITQEVKFNTHDGGVGVLRQKHPGLNVFGKIIIGNNVFIGAATQIMPGVTVGNNVVIGAGSIVTRDIPDNVVAAGVPARVIKTIEEYEKQSLKRGIVVPPGSEAERRKAVEKAVREVKK
jgi:acetyltransferase-like isoleucine patch superfamily enzyme